MWPWLGHLLTAAHRRVSCYYAARWVTETQWCEQVVLHLLSRAGDLSRSRVRRPTPLHQCYHKPSNAALRRFVYIVTETLVASLMSILQAGMVLSAGKTV